MSFSRSILIASILLSMNISFDALAAEVRDLSSASMVTSKAGLSVIYPVTKKVSGRVALVDGSPVETRFYVQDISQTPPVLVATYHNNTEGFYDFDLGIGQWRVVPISSEFKFEPRAREYDVRLQSLRQ